MGSGDTFDHADFARAANLPREPGGGSVVEEPGEIGAADPDDVDLQVLQSLERRLKKDASLVVVSLRITQPSLSHILIEALPKRCLMQVPSTRVEN